MAYSWTDVVASGGQQNFAFSIPYLSREHIHVYINGEETEAWSFLLSQVVRLDSGAALNDTIRVRRITPIDEPIVDYNNGSFLGEEELDATALQSLFVAQELDDDADNTIRANASLRWNALDRRIINVGTPVDDNDAATKDYVDSATGGGFATAAAASAAAALLSANTAEAAVTAAEAAVVSAEAAETSAEGAQAAAEAAQAAAEAAAASVDVDAVKGTVRMYRTGSGTWAVYGPNNEEIDISSSTTEGLQEAINYACDEGYDLYVHGGGIKPGVSPEDVAVINCSTGIVFPPMQNKTIRIGACTVNFTSAVTGIGVFFDSCMMVDLDWNGQIVYQGNSDAVSMCPTSNVPYDAVTACVDSKFKINHIATIGGTNPVCWRLNSTNGPIMGCCFESFEINGINVAGSRGLLLAQATNGIISNVFNITRIHLCKTTALAIGTGTTDQNNIHSNVITCHIFGATGGTTVGVDVFGDNNLFMGTILANEGALTQGIHWQSGAANNLFIVPRNEGSTAVQNDSGGATNKVNFA